MAVETQVAIRELDLSACHANTLSDKINAVPGLKTSTGKGKLASRRYPT